MTVTVDLLDANGTLNTADLAGLVERGFTVSRARVGTGMGAITVHNDHPNIDDLTAHRLLRWNLDGTPVALSVIAPDKAYDRVAPTNGEEQTAIEGPGALAMLGGSDIDGAVVKGIRSSGLWVAGWPAPAFDDSSWPITSLGDGIPQNPQWPDPTTEHIFPEARDGNFDNTPNKTWWYREQVFLPAGEDIRFYWWWDNSGTAWFDGEQMASQKSLYKFESFEVESTGTHYLAATLRNHNPVVGGSNPTAMRWVAYRIGAESENAEIVAASEAGSGVWTDDPEPVTWGYFYGRLLTAAQSRGCLPGVTWTFTDTLDSNGDPWTTTLPVVSYRDGEPYGSVLRQSIDQFGGVEPTMLPDLELHVADQGGAASGVTLDDPGTVDAAVASAQVVVSSESANVVRYETPDGFDWREDTARVTADGVRRETSASFGTALSPVEVEVALDELLDRMRGTVRQTILTHGPAGARPLIDFEAGETVGATYDGSVEQHTVEAVSVTVDAGNDAVEFDLDLEHRL